MPDQEQQQAETIHVGNVCVTCGEQWKAFYDDGSILAPVAVEYNEVPVNDCEECEGQTSRLHYCGGAIFEETGEVRLVEVGEWYLGSGESDVHYRSHVFANPTAAEFAILRPVRVEADGT